MLGQNIPNLGHWEVFTIQKSVPTELKTKSRFFPLSLSIRSTQTDLPTTPTLVPICVPAFMPMPMQMYNAPYPVPIPVPVPVPVPVFVPTSRNSYR